MNKLPVYLYSNQFDVILDLDQNRGINQIMYQRKLKIQKGFKDYIQIQFKNSDQKPVSLSTSSNYWFDLIDSYGRQLVLTKPLTIIDDTVTFPVSQAQTSTNTLLNFADTSKITVGQSVSGFGIPINSTVVGVTTNTVTLSKPTNYLITTATSVTFNTLALRGVAKLELDPQDTINLTAASYKIVVKQANNDGTFTPAYANTYYGIAGDIEIQEDGYPIGFPVQTVNRAQLEAGKEYDYDINNLGYIFFTGWLRPYPSAMTTSSTQCVSINLNNFAGTIIVQGTLDNNPSPAGQANAEAFTITNYVSATPTQATIQLSWNTVVTAVRFSVKPFNDAFGVNYYPTGNPIGSEMNKFPNGFIDMFSYFS